MFTLGVLQADSVLPQFQGTHGDYPDMFERVLGNAAAPISFRHYDVEHGHYPDVLDECDGYLITGSKKSVYDDEAWIRTLEDFVRALHTARIKLVGICFGHQLVAQALGGETRAADVGWGVGVHTSQVIARRDFMTPPMDDFGLVVSHKDQVQALPAGAEVLAVNDHCPYASFVIGDHILTFQGHPEFTTDYSRDLMNMRRDILGESVYGRGVASLTDPMHADVMAEWIINFLLADPKAHDQS